MLLANQLRALFCFYLATCNMSHSLFHDAASALYSHSIITDIVPCMAVLDLEFTTPLPLPFSPYLLHGLFRNAGIG